MQSDSKIVMCAAGGGKTTRVVEQALASSNARTALVTYTRNNVSEIERKLYERTPTIPAHVEVLSWFTLLLREMARPYRRALHDKRIEGIQWVEGKSVPYIPQSNVRAHYFADNRYIYSDKISKFICECDRLTGGAVTRRLRMRFDHIIIDEVQDLAGYDIDVMELLLKAKIGLSLVGDHRQATFRTNHSAKNANFAGANIIKKFEKWQADGLVTLSYERHTHRCNQTIADLGDKFFPNEPNTKSLNTAITGHDGLFIVPKAKAQEYVDQFKPQILRLDKKTNCGSHSALNFGEAKGLTFDRVLIFPHGLGQKWLSTGDIKHVEKSASKMYVGVTRARFSIAFVYDGAVKLDNAHIY